MITDSKSRNNKYCRSIIRDVDKTLPGNKQEVKQEIKQEYKQDTVEKKDKSVVVKTEAVHDPPVVSKKPVKASKIEEKLPPNKSNDELSKKNDKKKDDSSRLKQTIKMEADYSEPKDSSKDSKAKKDAKEHLIKEEYIKKEIKEKVVEYDNIDDKKGEKKKYARHLLGKSTKKTVKKEKVTKVKTKEPGLSGIRKVRLIKEQIKNFVKVIGPFKKSKRGTSVNQQETSNKSKPDEDIPKLTRSKSKEDLPNRLRKSSVLQSDIDSVSALSSTSSGCTLENQTKVKKADDVSEKKKTVRKKKDEKDEKVTSNSSIPTTPISEVVDAIDKDSPVAVGDNLVVYYGDKHATTYDAKVLNVCDIEGSKKFYVHYKGWNSRYDEWIDITRIALKSKGPGPEPDHENDTDSSKNEPKNADLKKLPPRTRRSVTPSMSYSHRKKSPFSSVRPTRTCTLTDRPSSAIGRYTIRDNSDSESEYLDNFVQSTSKYIKKERNQQASKSIKIEEDTEELETDNLKKTSPKTYPSKEVLMQRSAPRKPKSCVFKAQSNKPEESEISEQGTPKPSFGFNFEMPPPLKGKKSNVDAKSMEVQVKQEKAVDCEPINQKVSPVHYLSPKEKSVKTEHPQVVSELLKSVKVEIKTEEQPLPIQSENVSVIYYPLLPPEEEEEITPRNYSPSKCDDGPPVLEPQTDSSKISGTDFDLNKIRSEMKGLMPASTNSNTDQANNIEFFKLDKPVGTQASTVFKSTVEDIYEFKDQEPCDIMPSVTEEKNRRIIKHNDPPKLYSFEKIAAEPPVIIESVPTLELMEQNEPKLSFEPMVTTSSFFRQASDDKAETNFKVNDDRENCIVKNRAKARDQSDTESNESNSQVINFVSADPVGVKKVKENVHKDIVTAEIDETDKTDEVLDLCMKPPESPPNNIFSMMPTNEANTIEDEEDDDETKLVIAENERVETDYQLDAETEVASGDKHYAYDQTDNVHSQPLPPLPPSIGQLPNTDMHFRSLSEIKRNSPVPKDIDDESTTSCNEIDQNALIQNFQMYSNSVNLSTKIPSYQPFSDNDDSTKSGFEFESSSKSPPTNENCESAFSFAKSANKDKPRMFVNENEKIKINFEKEKNAIVPELQCREEIVDEETLSNALVVNYNRKSVEYDIHKPSTSKGFFDSIHQSGPSKNDFYDSSNDTKNTLFEAARTLTKSVIFDTNASKTYKSNVYDDNTPSSNSKDSFYDAPIPSTSKISFYENPVPSTSKSFYSPEPDANNVLFCEETIPGSPTGTSEEQYDHEEKKRAMAQALFEEREAASAMYAMNRAFSKPLTTIMNATHEEVEEYNNILRNDGILDQRHLEFLAEISSRNRGVDINKPSVDKSPEPEPETVLKQTSKSPEKPLKRKVSHDHTISKRSKTHSSTALNTESERERATEIKLPMPLKDGKPLVTFSPDLDTAQRQAMIMAKINELRKEFLNVKTRVSIVDRRRKKIRKRKRELAKVANMNQNKQSMTAIAVK